MRSLIAQLSPRLRRRILPLMLLMLAGAVAEIFTIGALIPFLAAIAGVENSPALAFIEPVLNFLGADDRSHALYAMTGIFALAAIVAIAVRLFLLWYSYRFIYDVSYELSVALYAGTLHEPYSFHTHRNSSEIVAGINKVQLVTNEFLLPVVQGVVSLVIAAFIFAGLIAIDPLIALSAGLITALVYAVVMALTRRRLRRNSEVIAEAQGKRIQVMQEGLGGIRDVILDRSQPVFVDAFRKAEASFRDARVKVGIIANSPRFLVEGAVMILIAVLAVAVVERPGGIEEAIPVLGAFALGAQRLLPLVQYAFNGWARALGNRQNLVDLIRALEHARQSALPSVKEGETRLPFQHAIRLDDVGYTYPGALRPALVGLSPIIPKGSRVGISGKTGSGKTTLMDLLIGLIEPTTGTISIDGVRLERSNMTAWQQNIAHVPQFIFLADATIAENIAFGVRPGEIDPGRVVRAAEQAKIADFIAGLPGGYQARIGERGVQLSGGQRQRLGIARALYKNASIMVFDEATSALDHETEAAVMEAIDDLDRDLTILITAHRLSTLEICDLSVILEDGRATMGPAIVSRLPVRGSRTSPKVASA